MNLEWKMRIFHQLMKLTGQGQFHKSTPEALRAQEKIGQGWIADMIFGKVIPLPKVEDMAINGRSAPIPIRVYRPTLAEKRPLLIYFHGGGWVIGNLNSHDRVCRNMAHHTGRVVVAVDYRLAPENKYPAAVEDAWDALHWAAENGASIGADTTDIAVAGDSAGGNLSAVLCQKARDSQTAPRISKQVLIYPAVDLTKTYPSTYKFAEAPILNKKAMDWFGEQYVTQDEDRFEPDCSPLLGRLENLPPAMIVTAEFDPLLDQGIAYAKALESVNNVVNYKAYARQVHGFFNIAQFSSKSTEAYQDIASFLQEKISESPPIEAVL
ncbi:MAG: alpha/beta hydrolase [Chloroflexota bacterium]